MRSQVGQWGNSLAIRIPKYVVESLDLKPNDAMECTVENGQLILVPIPIQALPELSLEKLLGEVTEAPESEVNWGKPMGDEV
jgi:antitoxin MazE